MQKNTLRIPIAISVMLLILFACNKADQKDTSKLSEPIPQKVEEQLKLSQQNLKANGLPLKIVSYKVESTIKNETDLAALKANLLNSNNYVPQFDGVTAASFAVNTIRERISTAEKSSEGEDILKNIELMALPEVKIGQKVLDIVWESSGKTFHSKCIYSNDGIVYDHVLSNIVFLKAESVPQESIKANLTTGSNSRTEAQYSFTATVLNYTITWAWGSTRGKIVIKHYIIWNGINYIIDHGGTADAWMSVGSASGRWHNNYLSRYSRSKMAWAYGWATPTASFSITFNSSNLTFSTSTGGVGSRGSGSGIHTIYLP